MNFNFLRRTWGGPVGVLFRDFVQHLKNFVILGEAHSMNFNFLRRTWGGLVGVLFRDFVLRKF